MATKKTTETVIDKLPTDLGREDLNQIAQKINEIIAFLGN